MKTSNKIIVIYLSVITILSVIFLCDNAIVAKRTEPYALELIEKINNTRIQTVNAKKLGDGKYRRLFYSDWGRVSANLYFTPTTDNIYVDGDTLNILIDEGFHIVFPYQVVAYENGELFPVTEYKP